MLSPDAIKLQKLCRLKKFDELESALVAAIENGLLAFDDIEGVIETIAEQNSLQRTESIVWFALSIWSERKGVESGLALGRVISKLFAGGQSLRSEMIELYRKSYSANIPHLEILLEMTLLRKNTHFAVAVEQLDKLLGLQPGQYFIDTVQDLAGKVVGVDGEKKELVVNIAGDEKFVDATAAAKFEPISSEDFRAKIVFENESLQLLAKENPEQLVIMVLKTFGPSIGFRQLKAYLTMVVLSGSWTKWWAQAKTALVHSTLIEMSDGNQPTFTLRNKPLSYVDRVLDEFQEAKSVEQKLVIILDFLRHYRNSSTPVDEIVNVFSETLLSVDSNPGIRLAAKAVYHELQKAFPQQVKGAQEAVEMPVEPATLLAEIYNDEIAKFVLTFVRERQPEGWYDFYAGVMPGASTAVCEWIAGEVVNQGIREPFTQAIESILHWPDRYVRAIVWLYKKACTGNVPDYLSQINRTTILTGLLTSAQVLRRNPPLSDPEQQKRALAQIKNAISNNDFALVHEVLKNSDNDYARYLKDTVPRNTGIGDAMSSDIMKILRLTHSGLFTKNVLPWQEDAIYTTQQALERKNQEFAKLVNVDIAHNAKTIGEAADRGDLSENAEFTAALEERDRLTERASRMRAEIKKAKIIEHEIAAADFVTIGSRVKALNLETNQQETFIFLGPWDADPQRSIFSYLSPLALSFMGKKIGETVTHISNAGTIEWKIEEIMPGI